MSAHAAALLHLFARYARVTRQAWRERQSMEGPRRLDHEAEFLPAALALRDTPVHPAPRVAMGLIMLFALVAVLWATLGRMDIVATAPGRIIPHDRVKLVQAMDTARVTAIHVRDGQSVKAGQVLIELDATETQANTAQVQVDLTAARLAAARARGMLAVLQGGPAALVGDLAGDAGQRQAEQRLLVGQAQEYLTRLQRLDAEIARRQAESRTVGEMVHKLEVTVPIARSRAADYKNLLDQNFVSRHGWLEREQAAIEMERDLVTQRARIQEIEAALVESRRQREALVAETRRLTLEQLHEAQTRVAALSQEETKAESRNRYMRLTAPVDGTVQQLAVHTVGGVVTEAQSLLVVVPREKTLVVEAALRNQDIGFVRPGQRAEVKIETFPFTKYGTLEGEVVDVSSDAIQDEKLGLYYAARVRLAQTGLNVDGRWVNLAPGMAVTAEVKTGTRRVIEYFLSPLLQYSHDSLRER